MIEMIAIGAEILKGATVNTNLKEIGQILFKNGYELFFEQTVLDDKAMMVKALEVALLRSEIIITTGGLGPTLDDLTKKVFAEFFKKKLIKDEKLKKKLIERLGYQSASLDEQSIVPEGVEMIPNHLGTASGFVFESFGKRIYVLPGVPLEMREMVQGFVINDIKKHKPLKSDVFFKSYYLTQLGEDKVDPYLRKIQLSLPKVKIGIYPSFGALSIEIAYSYETEIKKQFLEQLLKENLEIPFESYIFSSKESCIARALQKKMVERQKKLVVCESCTGGAIASKLTAHSGASEYFLGSFVVYDNSLKEKVLKVESKVLNSYGAVSQEVVSLMLKNSIEISQADYAIAVSGIAGPLGASAEKPIGTVVCGILDKNGQMFVWKILAKGRGKRESVIEYTTQYILGALYRYIAYSINPYESYQHAQ